MFRCLNTYIIENHARFNNKYIFLCFIGVNLRELIVKASTDFTEVGFFKGYAQQLPDTIGELLKYWRLSTPMRIKLEHGKQELVALRNAAVDLINVVAKSIINNS